MANLLWGKVFYGDLFAGILREEPGGRTSFTYDPHYLSAGGRAIAYTLPLQENAHIYINGLHPFFDNLVAEGWLEQAQTRLMGRRDVTRFELLLAFGFDCAGAVSVLDPEPGELSQKLLEMTEPKELAVLTSRASLSGVQPKLALTVEGGRYIPVRVGQLSTHIGKFPSPGHDDLVMNEYLTMRGFQALLPNDEIVDLQIGVVEGISEPALIIRRFDREKGRRVHFEEFNQMLGRHSKDKYNGRYDDLAGLLQEAQGGPPTEIYRLFARIMAGLLLGNTDMHFKNFALFHTDVGYRLTPSYDQVAAALYSYKTIALRVGEARDLPLGDLKARHLVGLARSFGVSDPALSMLVTHLEKNREAATRAIMNAPEGAPMLKENILNLMEKRWNGTFAWIGQVLSKRP